MTDALLPDPHETLGEKLFALKLEQNAKLVEWLKTQPCLHPAEEEQCKRGEYCSDGSICFPHFAEGRERFFYVVEVARVRYENDQLQQALIRQMREHHNGGCICADCEVGAKLIQQVELKEKN